MDSFDRTRREINSSRIFGNRFVRDGCVRRCTGTKRSWLQCGLLSGVGESVLLFPGIQMLCCTGPPALGDKWQNSTFHPLPSSYLSAVHGRRAHVWMERILYGIRDGRRAAQTPPAHRWKFSHQLTNCNQQTSPAAAKLGPRAEGATLTQGPRRGEQVCGPRRTSAPSRWIYSVNFVRTNNLWGRPARASHPVN